MSELKTLKDIKKNTVGNPSTFRNISEDDLRKEAIKHYHRSDDNKHKFIREFFNITEEEIKDASGRKNA